jgi:glycosyltransferase involved in cell wall biosynthesis
MRVSEVEVVPVGLDLRKFPPAPPRTADDEPVRIVSVGELTARKGFDLLLEAMQLVWQHAPDAELDIMGEGELSSQLRRKAQSLARGPRLIRFHGFVADPYRELPRYSMFVLASRSDNLPVAIIEAMLAGLPVVATDVGGVSELVRDGGCGLLTQPDSAIGLAEKMVRMIRMDGEERNRLGANGERFARQRFAVERIVDELNRVYERAQAR